MRSNITLPPRQLALAVGAVALGGAVGTLLRDFLLRIHPVERQGWIAYAPPQTSWTQHVPWVLLAMNVVGVYAATWLLRGVLRHHDPNDPTRALVITGLLGGLTSYSGLFVDLAAVWHRSVAGGVLVAVGAVLAGVAAAALGLRGHRHR